MDLKSTKTDKLKNEIRNLRMQIGNMKEKKLCESEKKKVNFK